MPKIADALILCGGAGSRLRAAIGEGPKSLACVAGRPFLELLLRQLRRNGFHRIIMAVGYHKEMIRSYFGERAFSLELMYSEESVPLGTGGAVRNAVPLVTSPDVLIMNGDSYTDIDLVGLGKHHRDSGADVSIALVPTDGRNDCGNVRIGAENSIMSFEEKQHSLGEVYVNAGIYVIARRALEEIPSAVQISLERQLFPGWLVRGLRVKGFIYPAVCVDIGTPERYSAAQATLASVEQQDASYANGSSL